MNSFICTACGSQFQESDTHPLECPICLDDRQYVNLDGQQWTTLNALASTYKTVIREEGPLLRGIGVEPRFAIGQRALLLKTGQGNILWDCVSLIDEAAIQEIQSQGGLSAIAISHPHYYTSMLEWSRAFGRVPIYLHARDRQWVMRSGSEIVFWEGETKEIGTGLTLIRCGGHFDGGTVLHWAEGAALLSGDIVQVVPDRRYVSFMYSYPNYIPLNARQVKRIADALEPYHFEKIFGAFWSLNITADAKAALAKSVNRYLRAIA
jgi:glyoxylase-like metal-dependent hydrolase (beta-lactamase superfamily II)